MTATSVAWVGPTNDCWSWVLGHFENVIPWKATDALSLLEANSITGSGIPTAIMFALGSRSDPNVEAVFEFAKRAEAIAPSSDVPRWCVVLGSDWMGHRRTHPLPEEWQSFYWYQLHDQILPWCLNEASPSSERSKPTKAKQTSAKSIPPRISRILNESSKVAALQSKLTLQRQSGLIVTDSTVHRELWLDVLRRYDMSVVASSGVPQSIYFQPSLIVLDWVSRSIGQDETIDLLKQIRHGYPEAYVVAVDGFPQWNEWEMALACGVDSLAARPANVAGLLRTWQHWQTAVRQV